MDWQQTVSLFIVACAVAALVWGRFRPRKFSLQRDTHCGCAGAHDAPTQSSLVFHARKGERARVLVKMK